MLPFRFRSLFRAKFTQSLATQFRKLSASHYHNSENKDPTEGEKVDRPKKKSNKVKKTDSTDRVNILLKFMDESKPTSVDNTEIARPKQRELKKDLLETKAPKHTEAITHAVKEVAESFGGDVKLTEVQLLSKVSSQSTGAKADSSSSSSSSSSSGSSSSSDSSDDEASSPKKAVAPSELKEPKTPTNAQPTRPSLNLSELLVGMKIDRNPRPKNEGRASQVRKILGQRGTGENQPWRERAPHNRERGNEKRYNKGHEHRKDAAGYKNNDRWDGRKMDKFKNNTAPMAVTLFGKDVLGIFDPNVQRTDRPDICATWQALKERETHVAAMRPPENHFEEMILWTEQGKLWRFPVDNEQGLDEERSVSFAEHVFLEGHLEPWCPRKGPVRHFMELVCIGLSKNPYLTAKEKRDHIEWFRDYFRSKHDLLAETGALADVEEGGRLALT